MMMHEMGGRDIMPGSGIMRGSDMMMGGPGKMMKHDKMASGTCGRNDDGEIKYPS